MEINLKKKRQKEKNYENKLILTSVNVLIDKFTIFPAVNFIEELDIAMIKMQKSFLFPINRYHSIMYDISPIFLHYHNIISLLKHFTKILQKAYLFGNDLAYITKYKNIERK